jgi:hypothetical protein
MSAYERSGVSRGADPASNGPSQGGGISKRTEQIHPKGPHMWGFLAFRSEWHAY